MNMKKTIAALAAGALAVSAMATTASAEVADQVLNYNLVRHESIPKEDATATLRASFLEVTGKDDELNYLEFVGVKDVESITIRIIPDNVAEQTRTYTYFAGVDKTNYNPNLTKDGFKFENELAFIQKLEGQKTATVIVDVNVTLNGTAYDNEKKTNTAIKEGDIAIIPWAWDDEVNKDVEWKDGEEAGKETVKNNKLDKGLDEKYKTSSANKEETEFPGKSTPTIAAAYTAPGKDEKDYPMETGLNGAVTVRTGDIITYLETAKLNKVGDDYRPYYNVQAVLNDAVENYETVVFTFHTATKKVGSDGSYDDGGSDQYLKFPQHLYYNYFDGSSTSEMSGMLGYTDWTGANLFVGGLVINERYTMSLSDAQYFTWNETTMSFDYDAIMDGIRTNNAYASYIHTMKLATSAKWYWDSLDVVLTATAADKAEAEAPAEGDTDVIDDGDDDGDVIDDGDDDGDVVDTDDGDDDEGKADVQEEQKSPVTGNAPVALAVIPVALAAAAVVAKKRS